MEMIVSLVVLGILTASIITLNSTVFTRDSDIRNMQTGAERLKACAETVISTRQNSSTKLATDFSTLCGDLAGDGFSAPKVTVSNTPPSSGTNDPCPSGELCRWVVISLQRSGAITNTLQPVTIRLMNY